MEQEEDYSNYFSRE